MKSSKMLELKDIFKKDSGYLNKLSDCCRADLKKQLENIDVATDEMFEEGTAPVYENYSNFVLLQNDIVIIFGQYQIAPYAAGMFGVRIPYEELSSYLAEGLF
ncbi:MAG: RsiV family protein, partial [Actinomycetota bacterium]|nr:RsiV family protein [Actinomycetota bacterium]